MTHEEILKGLHDDTLVGNAPSVKELVETGLAEDLDPSAMLYDALIPSLEEVGARFERGDYFVPEMLIAARAMQGALDILRPLLAETGAKPLGTYVMGTVKGDVHDIGKNLVNIMLEGAGFTVHDLGVNVAPETFVAQVQEHRPDIVGFSAFLTTTMPMFKANINALEKAGIRDEVIVMVGGAPVTQEYADKVGADGYAADASAAVRLAKDLMFTGRALTAPCRTRRPSASSFASPFPPETSPDGCQDCPSLRTQPILDPTNRTSTWSAPSRRRPARRTTRSCAAPASSSTSAKRRCTRRGTWSSRWHAALSARRRSPATCASSPAARRRGGRAATRSPCSSRSGSRSRIWSAPVWCSKPWRARAPSRPNPAATRTP